MKFKEVEIVRGAGLFGSYKVIASYHDFFNDHKEMIDKITSFPPHKGDCIRVIDKMTHEPVFLQVSYCTIDYVENKLTIWCR